MKRHITIANNSKIPLERIPVLPYGEFLGFNTDLLGDSAHHCVAYFGFRYRERLKLICCIANDHNASVLISSAELSQETEEIYPSFTAQHIAFHIFERLLAERFGIRYTDHPWLKPVRYAADRFNKDQGIEHYPFYQIKSEELHEVGVGPVHAGIIEPGHFRFICNGEQILHLETQHGYQHRGVEQLFLTQTKLLRRTLLAESVAGDSVAGHALAFVNLWETLCEYQPTPDIRLARTLALELERIAVHTGDLSAICTDIGYQLGSAVFGRLRTPIINFFQEWCGNRLAKGLIRPAANPWYFSKTLATRLEALFREYEADLDQMWKVFRRLPGAMARLEKTGVVTQDVGLAIGAVGMAARASGIKRDIRTSHPHDFYSQLPYDSFTKYHGDVYARAKLRYVEILQSISYIRRLIKELPEETAAGILGEPPTSTFAITLVEGWRGEICHCAVTDEQAQLHHYAIKDPSLHNWLAVAMAVRNNEISDFPICNKSFNLSYCGHDL